MNSNNSTQTPFVNQEDLAAQINSTHQCPKCKKLRLIRPKGYVISLDMVEVPGLGISIPKDICDYCIFKIGNSFKPKNADIEQLLNDGVDDGKSREDLV